MGWIGATGFKCTLHRACSIPEWSANMMYVVKILKGTQAKDASWPENVGNVLWNGYLYLHFSFGGSINIHTKKVPFCFESELLRMQPCWFTFYKRRKRLDWDVFWCTSVLCTGFKNDVTDIDCRPQNGGTYGLFLGTFNKKGQKSCDTFLCTGFFVFFIPFLARGPMMLLQFGSPLTFYMQAATSSSLVNQPTIPTILLLLPNSCMLHSHCYIHSAKSSLNQTTNQTYHSSSSA